MSTEMAFGREGTGFSSMSSKEANQFYGQNNLCLFIFSANLHFCSTLKLEQEKLLNIHCVCGTSWTTKDNGTLFTKEVKVLASP